MERPSNEEASPSEIATAIGEASQRLRRIRLALPRQHGFVAALEALRCSGINRLPGEGCRGLRVIEKTGSGKSEAAKQMVRFVEMQAGRQESTRPVLHVTMATLGTPRSAIVSCLKEFRSGYSTKGTEDDLLERLRVAIEEQETELIIVDELNHCASKSLGRDVSDTFKNMLTAGWAPIAFLGTGAAKVLFEENKELRGRCRLYRGMGPMDPHADLDDWIAFASGMEEQMLEMKLVLRPIGLDDPDLARKLCVACGGAIGELVNVLDDALALMMNEGGQSIEEEHLSAAVEVRFVLDGDLEANPLEAGE